MSTPETHQASFASPVPHVYPIPTKPTHPLPPRRTVHQNPASQTCRSLMELPYCEPPEARTDFWYDDCECFRRLTPCQRLPHAHFGGSGSPMVVREVGKRRLMRPGRRVTSSMGCLSSFRPMNSVFTRDAYWSTNDACSTPACCKVQPTSYQTTQTRTASGGAFVCGVISRRIAIPRKRRVNSDHRS